MRDVASVPNVRRDFVDRQFLDGAALDGLRDSVEVVRFPALEPVGNRRAVDRAVIENRLRLRRRQRLNPLATFGFFRFVFRLVGRENFVDRLRAGGFNDVLRLGDRQFGRFVDLRGTQTFQRNDDFLYRLIPLLQVGGQFDVFAFQLVERFRVRRDLKRRRKFSPSPHRNGDATSRPRPQRRRPRRRKRVNVKKRRAAPTTSQLKFRTRRNDRRVAPRSVKRARRRPSEATKKPTLAPIKRR